MIINTYVTPTFMWDVIVEFTRHKPRKGSKTKTKHFQVEAQNPAEAGCRVMNKLKHSKRISRRFRAFRIHHIKITDKPEKPLAQEAVLDPFEQLFNQAASQPQGA